MPDHQELDSSGVADQLEGGEPSGDTQSDSDLSTSPQALLSVQVVPKTPHVDSSRASQATVMSITSHINRSVRQSPKFPMVGTPLAVGAIRGRKSLSNRSYAVPVASPLQSMANLTASSRKTVQSALTSGEKIDATGSDVEVAEFEKRELELLLEVMRCQRNIRSLENELADARLRENSAVGNLYKFRAEEAERKLEGAEFDLGCVRNTMRQNEVGRHVPKRRRLSSPRSEPSRISSEG